MLPLLLLLLLFPVPGSNTVNAALQSTPVMRASFPLSAFTFQGFVDDDDDDGTDGSSKPKLRGNDDPPSPGKAYPTVLAHGMGDSCFNVGFSQLVSLTAERTGAAAYCIGAGPTIISDSLNSFLTTMDEQLYYFAKQVQANPDLSHGFNAVGLSQGNLIIRAYIHRYNFPPVKNFISIHGPHAGVAAFPRCDPESGSSASKICGLFDSLIGSFAYQPEIQTALAQSNFYRDPFHLSEYNHGCLFLPDILDKADRRPQYGKNLASVSSLNLVMAKRDTMIFPKESEYFGTFKERGFDEVIEAEKMPFFETLGLRALDDAQRITRVTTEGE